MAEFKAHIFALTEMASQIGLSNKEALDYARAVDMSIDEQNAWKEMQPLQDGKEKIRGRERERERRGWQGKTVSTRYTFVN